MRIGTKTRWAVIAVVTENVPGSAAIRRPGALLSVLAVFAAFALWSGCVASAQESTPQTPAAPAESAEPAVPSDETADAIPLSTRQEAISARFKRFERTLRQMAEYMRSTDPERAELLFRAINRSQEDRVAFVIEQIVVLLEREQLGDASERQEILGEHLAVLLELLQSEDRLSAIEREKQRLQELIQSVDLLIGKEKDVRVATERGGEPGKLTERQQKVAGETDALLEKIRTQDAERKGDKSSPEGQDEKGAGDEPKGEGSPDGKQPDGKPSDGKPQDGKSPEKLDTDPSEKAPKGSEEDPETSKGDDPSEKRSEDPKAKPSEKSPGEPSSEKSGKPQQGKPSDGKPSSSKSKPQESPMGEPSQGQSPQDSQPQDSPPQGESSKGESQEGEQQPQQQQPNSENTPGREELEEARDAMEQAIKELEKEARGEASKEQDEAIRKLREAKEQLEEILRQLREEERKLVLASLESRFQRMLQMQTTILGETVRLGDVPEADRNSQHTSRAIKLARDEEAIVLEADKALNVLKEEGSSVAFPEAVEQLRNDMLSVVRLLERGDVGELTQGTEEDIIEGLKEMVEALQREMEKSDKQQQQQQKQQGRPQDRALVDQLAELKMLRSLQHRINGRTRRLGLLIDGELASDPEVMRQLQELAARQGRIQRATYDIVSGRTKTDDSGR